MSPPLALALALVRGWTRLYTANMAPPLRDARRAEIESDLWEFHEDARRRRFPPALIGAHMIVRLVLGAGSDLAWRAESVRLPRRIVQDALWAAAVASIALIWWLASTLQALEPPERLRTGGINVVRLLYPLQPVSDVPQPPPPPRYYARLSRPGFMLRPPPPPPPPPQPAGR